MQGVGKLKGPDRGGDDHVFHDLSPVRMTFSIALILLQPQVSRLIEKPSCHLTSTTITSWVLILAANYETINFWVQLATQPTLSRVQYATRGVFIFVAHSTFTSRVLIFVSHIISLSFGCLGSSSFLGIQQLLPMLASSVCEGAIISYNNYGLQQLHYYISKFKCGPIMDTAFSRFRGSVRYLKISAGFHFRSSRLTATIISI